MRRPPSAARTEAVTATRPSASTRMRHRAIVRIPVPHRERHPRQIDLDSDNFPQPHRVNADDGMRLSHGALGIDEGRRALERDADHRSNLPFPGYRTRRQAEDDQREQTVPQKGPREAQRTKI